MGMKFIKIFVASSIVEFKSERDELGEFIGLVNNTFVKVGTYIELVMCEHLSNALALKRKQDEYDQYIRESQYFCILLGKSAGDYTMEEFYVAQEQFQETGLPRILVYFSKVPDQTAPDKDIEEFQKYLAENGYDYLEFSCLEQVKQDILQHLANECGLQDGLKIEGENYDGMYYGI